MSEFDVIGTISALRQIIFISDHLAKFRIPTISVITHNSFNLCWILSNKCFSIDIWMVLVLL